MKQYEREGHVMKRYTGIVLSTIMVAGLLPLVLHGAQTVETDVCVYGGASGGVAAAVQAARQGKRVALLVFNRHLGGLSSSGLGATDVGSLGNAYIQGLSREFYVRIGRKYGVSRAQWTFEPYVAESVFNDLVKEAGVSVYFGQRLARTTMEGRTITQIAMDNGDMFRAKVFIDASYEGDLLKQAGVSYTVGREANAQYGETLNGIQTRTHGNQLPNGIDPYRVKGDPASGLLPGVNAKAGEPDGSADTKIQAYCYRLCLTDDPTNRVMIAKPEGYNEADYELLFRAIEAGQKTVFFKTGDRMPKRKTDSNNASGISFDHIGHNYDYPEADHARRAAIAKAHEHWQRGLIWTLQHHSRVPVQIREAYAPWGLAADEFQDNDHWPYELYVREARRMVSDYVMTEKHCTRAEVAGDSVGLAAYTMDSHNCQRIVLRGGVKNEGDVQKRLTKPFPVSYRALVPKAGECGNLLVPWCMSATHIAFASLRMEPVFMILGQSVGAAACLAIDEGCAVQQIPYGKLKARLIKDGQCLALNEAPRVTVINKGVSGRTSTEALARAAKEIPPLGAQYAVVYLGMNDALNSRKLQNPELYEANLRALVGLLRQHGARTVALVTIHPVIEVYVSARHPRHPRKDDLQAWLAGYDQIVRKVAASEGCLLVDLRALVEREGGATISGKSLLRCEQNGGGKDGVHLTAAGYARLGKLVFETMGHQVKAGERVVCFGDSLTYGSGVKGAGGTEGESYPAVLQRCFNERRTEDASATSQVGWQTHDGGVFAQEVGSGFQRALQREGLDAAVTLW